MYHRYVFDRNAAIEAETHCACAPNLNDELGSSSGQFPLSEAIKCCKLLIKINHLNDIFTAILTQKKKKKNGEVKSRLSTTYGSVCKFNFDYKKF